MRKIKFFDRQGCKKLHFLEDFRIGSHVGTCILQTKKWIVMLEYKNRFS